MRFNDVKDKSAPHHSKPKKTLGGDEPLNHRQRLSGYLCIDDKDDILVL